MATKQEREEPDYLAGAQPAVDPRSFRQRVREAFALEYQTTKDGQIAAIIGRDKSRISQLLNDPGSAESSTIRHLVSFLKSRDHRRLIIEAWERAYFGEYLERQAPSSYLGATATERTRKRIDRLIREGQLGLAARVSIEAFDKANDPILAEELLDRACFLFQRLDQPGQAMRVAKRIATRARERSDVPREVAGQLMRCRILLGLTDARPDEILPVLAWCEQALQIVPEPAPQPYSQGTWSTLAAQRRGTLMTFIERGVLPRDDAFIKKTLQQALRAARHGRSYQARHKGYLLAVRCYLLLGNQFQAEECLENAFKAGHVKNLHAYEITGILMARILARSTAPREQQGDYLVQVIENCAISLDRYHQRLAEWDLARVEADQFAPLMTE